MPVTVTPHAAAGPLLDEAGAYLAAEPVRANQVATILGRWAENGSDDTGAWVVRDDGRVVGVVLHGPPSFPAVLAPMPAGVAAATAERLAASGATFPGVRGEAAETAAFAGRWTEVRRTGAVPEAGERLYELGELTPPDPGPPGALRRATAADRELFIDWITRFHTEAGGASPEPPARRFDAYLAIGGLHVWDDGEPRTMVARTSPVAGVVRLGLVYTPADQRRRGYAGAAVAAAAAQVRAAGHRVTLYTQLANPTSNAIYRHVGFRAVAEIIQYRFD